MSSTSSSECNDYDSSYWQYEYGYNTNSSFRNAFGRNPFYPTMGHPLVYYAEVPQPIGRKHRAHNRRRDNPNCFVKAFRWYTEEHVPNKSVSPTKKPDMTGFATWLDHKYDQFLQESRPESEYHIKIKQTSTFEADKTTKNAKDCEPCGTKKSSKSPRRKKRRSKSNETGDARQNSNQSFQYILQPKDISRPASECCHPSNATVVSDSRKSLVRSQSYSNTTVVKKTTDATPPEPKAVEVKRSTCQCYIDRNNVCQASNANKQLTYLKPSAKDNKDFECQFTEERASIVSVETQYYKVDSATASGAVSRYQSGVIAESHTCKSPPPNPPKTPKTATRDAHKDALDIECQCPEEKILKVDVQSQSEAHETRPTTATIATIHKCCNCDFREFMRTYQPHIQSTSKPTLQCTCERDKAKDKQAEGVKFLQKTAQTSNHSIHLMKETVCVHEYPLFMKIVCADKLSNEKCNDFDCPQ